LLSWSFDLDHFKVINHTYGHLTGDSILRQAAARMKSAIRAYDSLGRYGGEEFLAVLPACDLPSAANHAERLREAVASSPFALPQQQIFVTCSIGAVSSSFPDAEAMIRQADGALDQAKFLD
jgi:diguanylate cyclase (GGDEF)-like protein